MKYVVTTVMGTSTIIESNKIEHAFFSICIPQFNRTSFLLKALIELDGQTFRNFEVCISDDLSTDRREHEIIEYLESSGLSYAYKRQESNLRYDGNLRESIALANGRYCFLHGNDDCLAARSTLEDLHKLLIDYECPEVAITNFQDYQSGEIVHRANRSRIIGAGPEVAANQFRNLSFVSGLILNTSEAQKIATDKWDGFEMYQMYIISRIIASGGRVLALNKSSVRKDIYIPNEQVDSYSRNPVIDPCPIIERKVHTVAYGRLVVDAISDYLSEDRKRSVYFWIFVQLYIFTISFWIIEHRRIQSWKYALGIALGFRPRNVVGDAHIGLLRLYILKCIYLLVCIISLIVPLAVIQSILPFLYKVSRYFFIGN